MKIFLKDPLPPRSLRATVVDGNHRSKVTIAVIDDA